VLSLPSTMIGMWAPYGIEVADVQGYYGLTRVTRLVPCQTDGDVSSVVMPAEAGIQKPCWWTLDSRLRGNDAVTVRHQLHIDELLELGGLEQPCIAAYETIARERGVRL
jgi:hypothetical protein